MGVFVIKGIANLINVARRTITDRETLLEMHWSFFLLAFLESQCICASIGASKKIANGTLLQLQPSMRGH
jgi:hypothetical protein